MDRTSELRSIGIEKLESIAEHKQFCLYHANIFR